MNDRRNAERLWQRVARAFAIGRTSMVASESGGVARVQVGLNEMEILDGQVLVQHFGFASGLPVGTDTVHVFLAGDRSNGLIVGTNHQPSRPRNLPPGQSAMYDISGLRIVCTADGGVTITCAAGRALRVVGDLHVTGNVVWTCDSAPTDAVGHEHGGVMPGDATTGAPIAGS